MSASQLTSIVINNFNYADYLPEAIESALGQTSEPLEVIVVDDGSTDASREVLAGYRHQVKVILKENGGQASAVTAGFHASTGSMVLFLDADDVLLPGVVAAAREAFAQPDTVKVHWPLWEISAQGVRTGRSIPGVALSSGDLREHCLRQGPLSLGNAPTSGNAWCREFLSKVLPVPECGDRHGADAYLCTVAPAYGRIARLDQHFGLYRSHPSNFSGSKTVHRIKRDLRRYPYLCAELARHLGLTGTPVDPRRWQGPNSLYAWMQEALAVREEMSAVLPPGQPFILSDSGQLGDMELDGRRVLPFLTPEGAYFDTPEQSGQAIAAVERLRLQGASAIAFIRTTLWQLDLMEPLAAYLQSSFRRVETASSRIYLLGGSA